MKISQFVCDVVYRVGEFIKNLLADEPCKCCEIYREVLEIETQRARYYERLVLKHAGITDEEVAVESETTFLPVVHRSATLSEIRRAAEAKFKDKAEPAKESELTEAEKVFQANLNQRLANVQQSSNV